MQVDWAAVKAAADRVRDRMTLPLLVVALGLAIFAEGTARAVYLLIAALLCLNYGRYASLLQSVQDLQGDLQSLDNKVVAVTDGLRGHLNSVEKRVTEAETGMGALRQDLETLRLSIPPEKSYLAIKLLSLLILVMVVANAAVLFLGNRKLAEYGDKIADVISQVKEVEAKTKLDAKDASSKAEASIRRLSQELTVLKEKEPKALIIVGTEPQKSLTPVATPAVSALIATPSIQPTSHATTIPEEAAPKAQPKKGSFSRSILRLPTPTPGPAPAPEVRILMPSPDGIDTTGEPAPFHSTSSTPIPKLKIEIPSNRIAIETGGEFKSPEPTPDQR